MEKNRGGARPARSMAGAAGWDQARGDNCSHLASLTIKEVAVALNAGGLCQFQTEVLSCPA